MPRGCAVLPLFFSVLESRECLRGKPVSLCSDARVRCWHIEKQPIPLRRIQTWFSLEDVAQRSVCGPLQFLSYIYNALGHGRWFSCLLFISFLCPSSTLPLPLKRHHYTTGKPQPGWGNPTHSIPSFLPSYLLSFLPSFFPSSCLKPIPQFPIVGTLTLNYIKFPIFNSTFNFRALIKLVNVFVLLSFSSATHCTNKTVIHPIKNRSPLPRASYPCLFWLL